MFALAVSDYRGNEIMWNDDKNKWHQWSGTPNEDGSVTLVLADYLVSTLASYSHTYKYDANPDEPSKYIIIDRIEVKCTKKTSK
jgi:hypothetical protein